MNCSSQQVKQAKNHNSQHQLLFHINFVNFVIGKNSNDNTTINNSHSTNSPPIDQKINSSADDYLIAVSHPSQKIPLTQLLSSSEPEEFKPTEDVVITALNNHLLEDHIVSIDHLEIHKTLGEGKICNYSM